MQTIGGSLVLVPHTYVKMRNVRADRDTRASKGSQPMRLAKDPTIAKSETFTTGRAEAAINRPASRAAYAVIDLRTHARCSAVVSARQQWSIRDCARRKLLAVDLRGVP